MEFCPVLNEQSWKIPIVKDLLDVKVLNLYIDDFNNDDVTYMINELCIS